MFKLEIDNELHLELIHPSHAEETFAIVQKNKELFRTWLAWVDDTKNVNDTKAFINSSLESYAKHKSLNCMIFYKHDLVGNLSLLGIRKSYGVKHGELGYWLDADFHKKGIMQRAAKKIIEIGFDYYDLDKISLRCAVHNDRSCNVAKKLNFTHEGRKIAEVKLNDIVMDVNICYFQR